MPDTAADTHVPVREVDQARVNQVLHQPRQIAKIMRYLNSDALTDAGVEWVLNNSARFAWQMRNTLAHWCGLTQRQAAAVNRAAREDCERKLSPNAATEQIDLTGVATWPAEREPFALVLDIIHTKFRMAHEGDHTQVKAMTTVVEPEDHRGALVWLTLPRKVINAWVDRGGVAADMKGARFKVNAEVKAASEDPHLGWARYPRAAELLTRSSGS